MTNQRKVSETAKIQGLGVTVTLLRNLAAGVTLVTLLGAAGCTPEMAGEDVGPDAGMGSGSGSQMQPDAAVVETGPFALDCAKTANQMTPHCARPSFVPVGRTLSISLPTISFSISSSISSGNLYPSRAKNLMPLS